MTKSLLLRCGSCLLVASLAVLGACSRQDPAALAREFIAKGEFDAAAVQLRSAVQADPQSAELRVMLADVQERQHDLAGAQENLLKAIESGGDAQADALIPRVALIMLDRNETELLVRSWQAVKLADPTANSSLRGTVALGMLARQMVEPARVQLAAASVPTPSVQLAQAQLLLLEKQPKEALALLDLDGAAGKTAPWWVLRGGKRIAVAAGLPDDGLRYMQRAREAVPWHGGVSGELGEAFVNAGRFDDARKVYDELRKRHPGLFWSHYLGALLAHRDSRFDEAHAMALRALKLSPDHLPTQILAISSEMQKGELQVADKRLQAALAKHADSVPLWQLNAQVQQRLGRPKEAAAAIKRGLDLAPGNAQLLLMQSDRQLAAGEFKPALATLKAFLAARPQDPEAMLRLASAQVRAGDRGAAMALVEQAGQAATAAGDSTATGRVVAMALQMNNPALARKLADAAVARKPDEAMARLSLAAVQSAQNDAAGAWATTVGVLDKDAAHAGALAGLTAMARKPAEQAELLKRYQAAVDAGIKSPQAYMDYARLLRANPQSKLATPLAVLDKGVATVPTSVPLRAALVQQLMMAGDNDRAIATAQTGATMANASPAAGALLASTYELMGKTQQAAEAWRKLVAENPQRSDWRLRLAQDEASLGREAEAVTQLRALVADAPWITQAYQQLALLLARSDTPAALAVAQKLGQQPELKAAGLMLAGDVLATVGKDDEAVAQYTQAAQAGAAGMATVRIVALLDRNGPSPAGDRELEAALRKQPEDGLLLVKAAQRAQARGDAAKAADLLKRVVARRPNDPYLLNDLAWAQLSSGNADALANARRAAALLPDNANVLHTLGLALGKAGKKDEAVDALRAAANLAPTSATPRLNLAQALVAAGDKVGAAKTLQGVDGNRLPAQDKDSFTKLKAELGLS